MRQLGVGNRRNKLSIRAELCVWSATLQKKWIGLGGGGVCFGENFEVNILEGCVIGMYCNVDFGYRLSICSGTEKNHGKSGSNRLVLKTRYAPKSYVQI